ncbi:MAG: helix-turn-helix domain-containing protein [Verrucomicrobiales bacterium]|nr:helix-turn-helix domain-containing protein [Verrucomicrobiales bacterium]
MILRGAASDFTNVPLAYSPRGMGQTLLMADCKKVFGANVRRLRVTRGWTQEWLAEKADLSSRYIQGIEAGMQFPRIAALQKLRRALGCRWDDLLAKL